MGGKTIRTNQRVAIYQRDAWECQYCGLPLDREIATLDHIQPISLGGDSRDENLRTACRACNGTKLDRSEQWFRLFLALGQTKYADVITLDQYHRLRGLGVHLEPLPAIRFYYELKKDLE